MEIDERKPHRVETPEERAERQKLAMQRALEQALSEQDTLDALVRRSIEREGRETALV